MLRTKISTEMIIEYEQLPTQHEIQVFGHSAFMHSVKDRWIWDIPELPPRRDFKPVPLVDGILEPYVGQCLIRLVLRFPAKHYRWCTHEIVAQQAGKYIPVFFARRQPLVVLEVIRIRFKIRAEARVNQANLGVLLENFNLFGEFQGVDPDVITLANRDVLPPHSWGIEGCRNIYALRPLVFSLNNREKNIWIFPLELPYDIRSSISGSVVVKNDFKRKSRFLCQNSFQCFSDESCMLKGQDFNTYKRIRLGYHPTLTLTQRERFSTRSSICSSLSNFIWRSPMVPATFSRGWMEVPISCIGSQRTT